MSGRHTTGINYLFHLEIPKVDIVIMFTAKDLEEGQRRGGWWRWWYWCRQNRTDVDSTCRVQIWHRIGNRKEAH